MSHKRSTIVHEFYCTQCGECGIPVHRKYGQFREVGHLKKLYCLTCGKETNNAECISASKYDSSTFFEEFHDGKVTLIVKGTGFFLCQSGSRNSICWRMLLMRTQRKIYQNGMSYLISR